VSLRSLCVLCLALAVTGAVPAQAQTVQDHLQWKLVTDGTSRLGGGGEPSPGAPAPNLTGADATFLFRLDFQPLLNYGNGASKLAKKRLRVQFETGVLSLGRTAVTKADPALSAAGDALAAQGATITGSTTPAPSLTRQRAFTVGAEFSAGRTFDADAKGALAELGVVAKGHFDSFLEDARFFEEDGLTYVKVAGAGGVESTFARGEIGARFRLSQLDGDQPTVVGGDKGRNSEDLLVIEWLYQHSGALKGLVPGENSEHRSVFRFVATPRIMPKAGENLKAIKLVLGVEIADDFGKGVKDVRIFYGTNVDLRSLIK
jgi:hypothetical protein